MEQLNINKLLDREGEEEIIKKALIDFELNKKNLLTKRGIYLYGSPGSGKSAFINKILKDLNYDVIKFDAGDIRNKNIIETITKHNMSDKNIISMFKKKIRNIAIVMDEIDGMNSGDKGGINALIKLIRPKKTKKQKKEDITMIPIICIGNYHVDKKISEMMKVCTTIEIKKLLENKNIKLEKYDTTCPFVTRVWKKASSIGTNDYSIIIHGKHKHEETKATFSHSMVKAPSLIIKDLNEAKQLVDYIEGKLPEDDFYAVFKDKYSKGFDLKKDLKKIGVVNQTTMLASETEEISNFLKDFIINRHGEDNYKDYFADTRDTLCYATNENQKATYSLLQVPADLAIVVGGYNSSNTSHLVELCEKVLPTYFVKSEDEILSKETIRHFNYNDKTISETDGFIPNKEKLKVIITSGASCPDAVVDRVLQKLLSYFDNKISIKEALANISQP